MTRCPFSLLRLSILLVLGLSFLYPSSVKAQKAENSDLFVGLWKAKEAYFRPLIRIDYDDKGAYVAFILGEPSGAGNAFLKTTVVGDSLFLVLNQSGMGFRGKKLGGAQVIEGIWGLGEQSASITLVPFAGPSRPQHPESPYPYIAEEVTITNGHDGVDIAGTLTIPRGEGPHPAVVLVGGSGEVNRDYEMNGHKPYLVLADHLTRKGFAVLRYDRRGVGQSQGNFLSASLTDFTGDASSAVRYLHTHPDINPRSIGIIGHSKGTWVALQVLEQLEHVSFLGLLMPPGVRGDKAFVEQHVNMEAATGATPAVIDSVRAARRAFVDILRSDADSASVASQIRAQFEALGFSGPGLQVMVEANIAPWSRDVMRFDPQPALRKIDVPIFVFFGEKDIAVSPELNAGPVQRALSESANEDVTVRVFNGINHWFQPADSGLPAESSSIETTIAPELLEAITSWMETRFANE